MKKLRLEYASLLQGEFAPGKRNLLFVFQVNCPGCFFYGFPMVNNLQKTFGEQLSFLGLSTAFEDFELNTHANTSLLLSEKKLVGETKKAAELTPITSSASICSLTRIVPSSDARLEPTRPAKTKPVIVGASSSIDVSTTISPITLGGIQATTNW